jgi:uncharacterized paraquat-inducible protein A
VALIKCPECGTEVSSEAAACPKCGHPLRAKPSGGINMKDPVHVIGVVLVIIILLVGIVSGVQQCNGG